MSENHLDQEIRELETQLEATLNRIKAAEDRASDLRDEIKALESDRRCQVVKDSVVGIQLFLSTASSEELKSHRAMLRLVSDQINATLYYKSRVAHSDSTEGNA